MKVLTVVIKVEGCVYVAKCQEVGTASQGTSVEEVQANLREETQSYLEEFPLKTITRPILTTFEVAGDASA